MSTASAPDTATPDTTPAKIRRKNPTMIDMPSSVIAFCEIFGGTPEEFVLAAANRVVGEYRAKLTAPSAAAPIQS